jgi:hypothetical protein
LLSISQFCHRGLTWRNQRKRSEAGRQEGWYRRWGMRKVGPHDLKKRLQPGLEREELPRHPQTIESNQAGNKGCRSCS